MLWKKNPEVQLVLARQTPGCVSSFSSADRGQPIALFALHLRLSPSASRSHHSGSSLLHSPRRRRQHACPQAKPFAHCNLVYPSSTRMHAFHLVQCHYVDCNAYKTNLASPQLHRLAKHDDRFSRRGALLGRAVCPGKPSFLTQHAFSTYWSPPHPSPMTDLILVAALGSHQDNTASALWMGFVSEMDGNDVDMGHALSLRTDKVRFL